MTLRRGPFRPGERVQLTDPKGRHYTINLTVDGYFQSTRGSFRHSELIGKEEGSLITTEEGREFLALRPLLSDYVLSMPRGATIVYPKDAAQITHTADIYPGARVFEAGVGSGALSISLLQAVGPQGFLLSAERRPEFAEIAQANLVSWWGSHPENWQVECGEAADILAAHPAGFDRGILDMLAPWEIIPAAAQALVPGGVFLAYVATTTQLSRCAEDLKATGLFTGPEASETLVRNWHLEGLAVRPDHRMVAHTGFLIMARRLAGPTQLTPASRPAKGAYAEPMPWENPEAEPLQERPIAEKKLRKVRRDLAHRADVEESGVSTPGEHSRQIAEKIAAEIAEREAEKRRQGEEPRYAEKQRQGAEAGYAEKWRAAEPAQHFED